MSMATDEDDKKIIEIFSGVSNKILDKHRKHQKLPNKLYHYTSSSGLLGIIKNHKLWFSDNAFMNDGSEVAYGIDMLRVVLRQFMQEKPETEQNVASKLFDIVREQSFFHRTIIFCMSDDGNLLNQWRDYGKDVTAYSIELDPLDLITKDAYGFNAVLFPLVYDQKIQEEWTRALVEQIYELAKNLPEKVTEHQESNLYMGAAAEISFLIGHFKNPAFQAENEWRLASFVPRASPTLIPDFRPSPLGVVPFYEWYKKDGGKLPISKIIVGPTPYADASHVAARQFMDRNGYAGVEVSYSTIPIRRA